VWRDLVLQNSGGIAINFESTDGNLILESLKEKKFFSGEMYEMTWQSEEGKFLEILR
jgi:hypothetical protein